MDIHPLEVLKWIGVVLAVGFIGYFGRYLSMLMIERIHRRESQQIPAEPTKEEPVSRAATPEEAQLKLEKKRAKAEAKKAKKEPKKQG